jgi:hypothetical protein
LSLIYEETGTVKQDRERRKASVEKERNGKGWEGKGRWKRVGENGRAEKGRREKAGGID